MGPDEQAPNWKSSIKGVPLLDFAREYEAIGGELLAAVGEVLGSQRFILGPQVEAFEAAATQVCQAEAVGCASGTDALWLAMAALGVGPGDAVVTTPFSFFATVSAILRVGARPLLADVEPGAFNLAPTAVRAVMEGEPGVRAILPVHLYGQCADMDRFGELRSEFGCLLVEDAAQAFGACWNGRPAGSLGDAAAFSFYPTKNLSAAGDAGMITASDAATVERARVLRAHGMRRRYYHDEVGWNSRLDSLQAAILLVKLKYVEEWTARRRALAANYGRLFTAAGLPESGTYPTHGVVLPKQDPRAEHVFHQYVLRVPRRDSLRAFLAEHRIGSEVYYPAPLHLQKALSGLGHRKGDFPESERAAEEVLALPIFPQLREDEQETVVNAVADFLS